MAVNQTMKIRGGISAQARIDIADSAASSPVAMVNERGELILHTKCGKISVDDLIRRLEALEQAYMEDKLLGKKD